MVRAPCCEKMGLKKGPWSPEEDQILISYIQKHGHGNWRALPKQAGLLRCGKSCRLRWTNYLRPDIKRGNFSKEEEGAIIKLHELLGNRWSAIAARLPGRTDNEIKNVWHTYLKKKLKNNQTTSQDFKRQPNMLQCDSEHPPPTSESSAKQSLNSQECSSEISSVTYSSEKIVNTKQEEMDFSSEYFPQIDESFWTEEFNENLDMQLTDFQMISDEKIQPLETDSRIDDSMDFWYNIFIRAGDLPDLPEF